MRATRAAVVSYKEEDEEEVEEEESEADVRRPIPRKVQTSLNFGNLPSGTQDSLASKKTVNSLASSRSTTVLGNNSVTGSCSTRKGKRRRVEDTNSSGDASDSGSADKGRRRRGNSLKSSASSTSEVCSTTIIFTNRTYGIFQNPCQQDSNSKLSDVASSGVPQRGPDSSVKRGGTKRTTTARRKNNSK